MTKSIFYSIALMTTMLLSSCELIGDIFKTGVYAGIFIVIAVIVLIIWLFRAVFRR